MISAEGYFDFSDSEEDEKQQVLVPEKVATRPSVNIGLPTQPDRKTMRGSGRITFFSRKSKTLQHGEKHNSLSLGMKDGRVDHSKITPVLHSNSSPGLKPGISDPPPPPKTEPLVDEGNSSGQPPPDGVVYHGMFSSSDDDDDDDDSDEEAIFKALKDLRRRNGRDSEKQLFAPQKQLPPPRDPLDALRPLPPNIYYGIDKQVQTPPAAGAAATWTTDNNTTTLANNIVATTAATHFDIVLIEIKKAAEERLIHCEYRHLESAPSYVALSYRWGELDEQMVPATKAYNARITSFQLEDFFKLCHAIHQEPNLKHIHYLWVDAICVDQTNMEKRKTTIYRMNDIFIHAAAIVAVPDLHAHHLSITTTANSQVMETLQRYRRYLYYLLVGTPEAQQILIEMDRVWMDDLGIPTMDLPRRDIILGVQEQQQQRGLKHTTSARQEHHRGAAFFQNMMALFATPPQHTTTTDRSAGTPLQDEQLPYRMMVEFQRLEWQQKLDQRQSDVHCSMQFLQSLMEDWSNRAWVISEYHIAKRKTGKLIFWFNQLSCPELAGLPFFEYDFVTKQQQQQQQQQQQVDLMSGHQAQLHPFTYNMVVLTSAFQTSMRRRLTHRSVLEMMVQTKASKNEDKFHSIIPLATDYKHHIKDRDSIAALGISDMLSVRMVLIEWMHTKDKLNLLYSECQRLPSSVPLVPTFASQLKDIKPALAPLLRRYANHCNFNLQDPTSVRLVRAGGKKDNALDELWLCPYAYHKVSREAVAQYQQRDMNVAFWDDLGLGRHGPLDAVAIPLFRNNIPIQAHEKDDNDENESLEGLMASTLVLVGSWDKNIWVRTPISSEIMTGLLHIIDKRRFPRGFRIY